MTCSQFSSDIDVVHFGNSVYDHTNWDKIYDNLAKKIHIWYRMWLFFRGEKPRKPTAFMKTMVVGQIYTNIPKSIWKENWKKNIYIISYGARTKYDLPGT